jgi:hypothetical protein
MLTRRVLPVTLALSLLGAIFAVASARAALVTWSFEGTVRDIEGNLPLPGAIAALGVQVGASASGSVQIETDTPPANPLFQATNSYAGAVPNVQVSIADWSLTQSVPGGVFVVSELDLGPGESLGASVTDSQNAATFSMDLSQKTGALWPTSAMLASAPQLNELDPYGLFSYPSTYFIHGTQVEVDVGGAHVHIEMSSLVPEPHAMALVLLASLSLVRRRRS